MRCFSEGRCCGEQGQATVEAAFLLPVLCAMLVLFLQPAFLLYDRCVMRVAAVESCRVAATATCSDEALEAFASRRLGAVPNLSVFHEGSTWDVKVVRGNVGAAQVTVTNRVQPLPLVGLTAGLLAYRLEDGSFAMEETASTSVVPFWAQALEEGPQDWVGAWE